MSLKYLLDLVTASLCLYNLCITHGDAFDMDQTKEAEEMMQNEINNTFENLKGTNISHVA